MVSGLGEEETGIGHRGLGEHEGHVARRERGLERGDVVELDDPSTFPDPRRETRVLRDHPIALLDHERRVSLAVVLAVEHQHDLPTGELPREADHLRIRLRGREGELPFRQPVAVGEVLGHGDRILAGQQKLVAELHPTRDGLDHRTRRVAAEGAHVGHVEVEVGVPVDVGEGGALAVGHPDRGVLVEVVHPRHRHAPGHRASRPLLQRHRSGPFGNEASVLGLFELSHAGQIDAGQVGHGCLRDYSRAGPLSMPEEACQFGAPASKARPISRTACYAMPWSTIRRRHSVAYGLDRHCSHLPPSFPRCRPSAGEPRFPSPGDAKDRFHSKQLQQSR